ncbi:MAG: methionyl-tRNA formyltransferase, partial [Dehalococcoidia bacterium]|nr:methionyl-tRNA formyltransferase [Dehalococcoidia bacterium]
MRTVLTGQAAFGAQVLEALIKRGDEVVGVFTGQQPGAAGPLKEVAEKSGLPLFQPARMKDPEVYEQFRNLNADLGVLAFVTDIVPGNVLRCPRLGSIQYHPSLLPRHRGASAMHWAVIDGDVRTGLTVFWADEGIDTGNILLQKEAEIGPDDTMGTLYFNKLFPLGVEAMVEAVGLVAQGRAPSVAQDHSQATYEPPCGEEHARVDWYRPMAQVYNLIRGTNPQPGAFTTLRGEKIKLFDAVSLPGGSAGDFPGAV